MLDFVKIYNSLDFLSDSVRMQYSNFILRHASDLDEEKLDEIIRRIKTDEPIEYVLNVAEFSGLSFYVDNRCLIPRPETQQIVSKAVEFINNFKEECTVIDVGTGSGCIILSVAYYCKMFLGDDFSRIRFIAIDISKEALEVAKINRAKLDLDTKVEFVESDFRDFDFCKHENLIICSNLPYIPNNDVLQKSVIDFEPHLALFGGEKGDELNNQLIESVKPQNNIKLFLMEGYKGEIVSPL
jgi:release factor glutamine methyltransferase